MGDFQGHFAGSKRVSRPLMSRDGRPLSIEICNLVLMLVSGSFRDFHAYAHSLSCDMASNLGSGRRYLT